MCVFWKGMRSASNYITHIGYYWIIVGEGAIPIICEHVDAPYISGISVTITHFFGQYAIYRVLTQCKVSLKMTFDLILKVICKNILFYINLLLFKRRLALQIQCMPFI